MYYAFGDCDLYLIADLPDETSAAALSLAIGAAGALDMKLTVLSDAGDRGRRGGAERPLPGTGRVTRAHLGGTTRPGATSAGFPAEFLVV